MGGELETFVAQPAVMGLALPFASLAMTKTIGSGYFVLPAFSYSVCFCIVHLINYLFTQTD
jgi:hypothetical protein